MGMSLCANNFLAFKYFLIRPIINFSNIHLFHDDDNLVALEQVSSTHTTQTLAMQAIIIMVSLRYYICVGMFR